MSLMPSPTGKVCDGVSRKAVNNRLVEGLGLSRENTLIGAPTAKCLWPTEVMIEDITAEAVKVSVPAVVIVGDRDGVEPEARLREEMPEVIP